MNFYATITDKNYLFKTLTLAESSKDNFSILCQDSESYDFLKNYSFQKNKYISYFKLHQIDRIEELKKKSINRTHREFSVSLKPFFVNHLLNSLQKINKIVFLDSDTFIFDEDNIDLFEKLEHDITISNHNHSKYNIKKIIYGEANAGVVGFKNNDNAKKIVKWWENKCLNNCTENVNGECYLDQKYLDQIPKEYGSIGKFDFNVNVAPWNIKNYNLTNENNKFHLDGKKLLIFHFQNLKYIRKNFYYSALSEYGIKRNDQLIYEIYIKYLKLLNENLLKTKKIMDQKKLKLNLKLLLKSLIKSDYIFID